MDIFFNIDNLIPPSMELQLDELTTVQEKLDFLFKLTDYTANFLPFEIDEIKQYWLNKTGEKYTQVYLDKDQRKFIKEYAEYFPCFDELKKLINGICTELTCDEAISSAQQKIQEEIIRLEHEKQEQSVTIIEKLSFDNDELEEERRLSPFIREILKY